MTIFTTLLMLLTVSAQANLACSQSFDDDLNPVELIDVKKNRESNAEYPKLPSHEARVRSQEISQALKEFNYESQTAKQWGLDLAKEIDANIAKASLVDVISYGFRMATLLSLKDSSTKYDLDINRFEKKDFENTDSLVNKLETIDFTPMTLAVSRAYTTLRDLHNLPEGYLLYPTFQKTPIRVMNTMLGTRAWIAGLILKPTNQHGISMSPFAYFIHDVLHFRYFVEFNGKVSNAALTRIKEMQESFQSKLSTKDQELFEQAYYHWWFERSSESTNLQNFFRLRANDNKESREKYTADVKRTFAWNTEIVINWKSEDISRAAELLGEFQQALFRDF